MRIHLPEQIKRELEDSSGSQAKSNRGQQNTILIDNMQKKKNVFSISKCIIIIFFTFKGRGPSALKQILDLNTLHFNNLSRWNPQKKEKKKPQRSVKKRELWQNTFLFLFSEFFAKSQN